MRPVRGLRVGLGEGADAEDAVDGRVAVGPGEIAPVGEAAGVAWHPAINDRVATTAATELRTRDARRRADIYDLPLAGPFSASLTPPLPAR